MQIYTKFSTNGLFLPKKSYDAPALDLFPSHIRLFSLSI